jgi:hypothetical protein
MGNLVKYCLHALAYLVEHSPEHSVHDKSRSARTAQTLLPVFGNICLVIWAEPDSTGFL